MSSSQQTELLKQLVVEVQGQLPGDRERQLALARLVDEILRSRKICRPPRGQPLTGVCQEIYEKVREQLLGDVDQDICNYNWQDSLRSWTSLLLTSSFKQVLDDARLKRLALEAQQYSPQTQIRQYALTELVNAIQLSGKLIHPPQGNISRELYQLIYDDAVNRTLLYVFQKIDNYDPQRGQGKFMNWVNFRLSKIFIELVHQTFQIKSSSLREVEGVEGAETNIPLLSEIIRQCIEDDPEGLFKTECVENKPNASFQAIFLAKRVDGKSWKEISEELGIPVTTISSFYWRRIQRFAPIIKKYVQEFA